MQQTFKHEDRKICKKQSLDTVAQYCLEHNLNFTKIRKRVLQILLNYTHAIGAYEILEILRQEGISPQPPVVYRALDFLIKNGFAHKIERMNAYAACMHLNHQHTPAFLICSQCEKIIELNMVIDDSDIQTLANTEDFQLRNIIIEGEGVCLGCRKSD